MLRQNGRSMPPGPGLFSGQGRFWPVLVAMLALGWPAATPRAGGAPPNGGLPAGENGYAGIQLDETGPGLSADGLADLAAAVTPYVTVVNNGPSANRVDLVVLGDGYTAAQIDTTYPQHVSNLVNYMFAQSQQPYVRYKNFYNVHRVNVVSNESGADVPPDDIYRDTALDASYYWRGGPKRLLYVNTAKAIAALNTGLAGAGFTAEIRLVTVNDVIYGGGGGAFAVYAGGNASATEIALHEMGHSFGHLADEYFYSPAQTWTGGEPSQPNVTASPTGNKWSQWLGYTDPDNPAMGSIGAFEGAMYRTYGLYRPSDNSKMRSLNRPFDAVGREQLILRMYEHVDPLDGWFTGSLVDPASLWVDTVDPAVLDVDWYVEGSLVAPDGGESFSLQGHGYGVGTYSVEARAYDSTGWVRLDPAGLTSQSVRWSVTLTPEPATLSLMILAPLAVLRRRRR